MELALKPPKFHLFLLRVAKIQLLTPSLSPSSLSLKSQSQWPIAIFLEGLSRYPLIFSHRSLFQFLVITPFLYSYLCVCVYVNSGFDFCGVFFSLVVYDGTGNTEASQWTRSLSFSLISWVSVCIYVFVFVGVWIYYYFVFFLMIVLMFWGVKHLKRVDWVGASWGLFDQCFVYGN